MPTKDDRGDIAAARLKDALEGAPSDGEWQSKMKARPYCPCCHHFDYHGPACPISGGMLSGEPITN